MLTWRDGVEPQNPPVGLGGARRDPSGRAPARRTSTVVNCPLLGFGKESRRAREGEDVEYLTSARSSSRRATWTAPIWVVENGTADQRNINACCRRAGYTRYGRSSGDLEGGLAPRTVRSASEVEAAVAAGEVDAHGWRTSSSTARWLLVRTRRRDEVRSEVGLEGREAVPARGNARKRFSRPDGRAPAPAAGTPARPRPDAPCR